MFQKITVALIILCSFESAHKAYALKHFPRYSPCCCNYINSVFTLSIWAYFDNLPYFTITFEQVSTYSFV